MLPQSGYGQRKQPFEAFPDARLSDVVGSQQPSAHVAIVNAPIQVNVFHPPRVSASISEIRGGENGPGSAFSDDIEPSGTYSSKRRFRGSSLSAGSEAGLGIRGSRVVDTVASITEGTEVARLDCVGGARGSG